MALAALSILPPEAVACEAEITDRIHAEEGLGCRRVCAQVIVTNVADAEASVSQEVGGRAHSAGQCGLHRPQAAAVVDRMQWLCQTFELRDDGVVAAREP